MAIQKYVSELENDKKMDNVHIEINTEASFNFRLSLAYLQTSTSAIIEQVNENVYSRVFVINDQPCLVTITYKGDANQTILLIHIQGTNMNQKTAELIIRKIKFIFSLENDPTDFYQSILSDSLLGPLVSKYRGIRIVLIADLYESLIWAIIGQQINVTFARKLKIRLLELCQCTMEFNGKRYYFLPTPEQVAELSMTLLTSNQFSQQKAAYILSTARLIINGEMNLALLHEMTYEEALKYLTQFHGIGKWTAKCILMRGIGFPDIFPAGDVGLQAIVGKHSGSMKKITENELRELSENWKPWRSWAAFIWWFQSQIEIGTKISEKSKKRKK